MDQTEFEDKKLSRHKRKRCDVANYEEVLVLELMRTDHTAIYSKF